MILKLSPMTQNTYSTQLFYRTKLAIIFIFHAISNYTTLLNMTLQTGSLVDKKSSTATVHALHKASLDGNCTQILRLLDQGVYVDSKQSGMTPLHRAVNAMKAGAIRLLLASGANPNALTKPQEERFRFYSSDHVACYGCVPPCDDHQHTKIIDHSLIRSPKKPLDLAILTNNAEIVFLIARAGGLSIHNDNSRWIRKFYQLKPLSFNVLLQNSEENNAYYSLDLEAIPPLELQEAFVIALTHEREREAKLLRDVLCAHDKWIINSLMIEALMSAVSQRSKSRTEKLLPFFDNCNKEELGNILRVAVMRRDEPIARLLCMARASTHDARMFIANRIKTADKYKPFTHLLDLADIYELVMSPKRDSRFYETPFDLRNFLLWKFIATSTTQ